MSSNLLKRTLYICVVATMCIALFTGCGSDSPEPTVVTPTTNESAVHQGLGTSVEAVGNEASDTVDAEEWMLITNTPNGFTLNIPASWSYNYDDWDGFEISGEGIGGTVAMSASHIPADAIAGQISDSISMQDFSFDNGHSGHALEFDYRIMWVLPALELFVSLSHEGDMSMFDENEDLILRIVRSLTPVSPNGTAQDTIAVAQGGNLDERLFGVWLEPIEGDLDGRSLFRAFYPDGTGSWGGDGPGQGFTWNVDGNTLTMDVYCHMFGDEWIEIYQYQISGDTITFTHADGWQRVYHREAAHFTTTQEGTGVISPTGTNEVLFNGTPVLSLLDNRRFSLSELSEIFGTARHAVNDDIMQAFHTDYVAWTEFLGRRNIFVYDVGLLTVNGVSLHMYRQELINLLGTPIFEGWRTTDNVHSADRWTMQYEDMTIFFVSQASRPFGVSFSARIG